MIFEALSADNVVTIAKGMLAELTARARSIGISLEFSDKVAIYLAKDAYEESFGARSVRREIIHSIENRLSSIILEGTLSPEDKLLVDIEENRLVFLKNSVCAL